MADSAEQLLRIARGLQLAGRSEAAITAYHRVLKAAPSYHMARRQLTDLHLERGEARAAIEHLDAYVDCAPLDAPAHDLLIALLAEHDGAAAPERRYALSAGETHAFDDLAADAVCAVLVVHNEIGRLPFVLEHHRSLGVSAFIVIDDASTDGTTELLHARDDVWLWHASGSYGAAVAGYAWVDVALRRLAREGWWLFLDADELFTYVPDEGVQLAELCRTLEAEGSEAMPAVLLDCYSRGPVADAVCSGDTDPRTVCDWFDREWSTRIEPGEPDRHWGGARQRVFPCAESYLLTKVPLVHWHPGVVMGAGAHRVSGAAVSRSRQAALLHFKFLSSAHERAADDATRGELLVDAHYRGYRDTLGTAADLTLHDPRVSVRYERPSQLAELGIVR